MTIIGTTERGFILQCDEYEVARLIGFYSNSDCRAQLKVGAEIKVNAMYEQLYKLRSVKNQIKALESAATDLLEMIKIKSPIIDPVVQALVDAQPK